MRSVAQKYNIPYTTLLEHVKGKYVEDVGPGRSTTLTHNEEKGIAYCCQVLQKMGSGMTKDIVCVVVMDYLETNNCQHNFKGSPRWDWWNAFLKNDGQNWWKGNLNIYQKNKLLVQIRKQRKWFAMVKESLEKLNIADQSDLGKRLWNCDETGICTALQSKKNSGMKGFKVGT